MARHTWNLGGCWCHTSSFEKKVDYSLPRNVPLCEHVLFLVVWTTECLRYPIISAFVFMQALWNTVTRANTRPNLPTTYTCQPPWSYISNGFIHSLAILSRVVSGGFVRFAWIQQFLRNQEAKQQVGIDEVSHQDWLLLLVKMTMKDPRSAEHIGNMLKQTPLGEERRKWRNVLLKEFTEHAFRCKCFDGLIRWLQGTCERGCFCLEQTLRTQSCLLHK